MEVIDLANMKKGQIAEIDPKDLVSRKWYVDAFNDTNGTNYKAIPPSCFLSSRYVQPHVGNAEYFNFPVDKNYYCQNLKVGRDLSHKNFPVIGKFIDALPLDLRLGSLSTGICLSGWDPEIFVEDGAGELIPAFEFLPEKDKAFNVESEAGYPVAPEKAKIYNDGFQAEFTTHEIGCHETGFQYLKWGLASLHRRVTKKYPGAKLSIKSVYRIPNKVMMGLDDKFVNLGCTPSLSAYGRASFYVEEPRSVPYRVAGGHVHFQVQNPSMQVGAIDHIATAKAMDIFCGIPTVAMFEGIDDPLRREYYGRAGEYRAPEYGIEYRTLSNAWLGDPQVGHFVMEIARRSVAARTIPNLHKELSISEDRVQEIINFCDIKGARKFVEDNWETYVALFAGKHRDDRLARNIIQGGVLSMFPDYGSDLPKAWGFNDGRGPRQWRTYVNDHPIK